MNKYFGSIPKGRVERYLINSFGDIYKCNLITFNDFSDAYYSEVPESFKKKYPNYADIYPNGWWSKENCFENLEDAKKRAIEVKFQLIKNTEKEIEKCRKSIKGLEDDILCYQDDIINYNSDNFSIIDTIKEE